jgi:anti-sigma factor (TIGR02949 family)
MSCGHPHETDCGKVHEMIDPYLDAELDTQGCDAITQHFKECPDCERDYYLVRTVKVRVHRACGMSAPDGLRMMIITRLRGFTSAGE